MREIRSGFDTYFNAPSYAPGMPSVASCSPIATARRAAVARAVQAVDQHRIRGIDIQADDVHGARRPRDRNLDAAQVAHAERFRLRAPLPDRRSRRGRSAPSHAAGMSAARDVGRRQQPVGNIRMAVEIGVHCRHGR